jgi:hypothetical protein
MQIFKPPDDVFLYKRQNAHATQNDPLDIPASQNDVIPMVDTEKGDSGMEFPETGGMLVWLKGKKYPVKGQVYPEALRDTYYPKRILINAIGILASRDMLPFLILFGLLPRRIKGRILDRLIDKYLDITDQILSDHYLKPRFYTTFCRGLSQPIMTLLQEMGVSELKAARMSLALITLIEYDGAYRLRIEDLLSETTGEKLLADPVGEAQKLIKILAERDWSRPHLVEKFNGFAKLMKYGFFQKPFRKALSLIDFSMLQLDNLDRYQARHWRGYNWFGMTLEERLEKWPEDVFPAYQIIKK